MKTPIPLFAFTGHVISVGTGSLGHDEEGAARGPSYVAALIYNGLAFPAWLPHNVFNYQQ